MSQLLRKLAGAETQAVMAALAVANVTKGDGQKTMCAAQAANGLQPEGEQPLGSRK